jgi:magnesium-transporting ATPase (P-type)
MTSLPIMFYALFDFEHLKNTFMQNPYLYKIGMNSECFSNMIFVKWLAYAMFHSFLIYIFSIIGILSLGAVQADGKDIGFWAAGHLAYGGCVVVANIVILHKFNNFTSFGEMLVGLMILAYFVFLGLESMSGWFPVVNHIFANMFSIFCVWASLMLTLGQASAGELAVRAWR